MISCIVTEGSACNSGLWTTFYSIYIICNAFSLNLHILNFLVFSSEPTQILVTRIFGIF